MATYLREGRILVAPQSSGIRVGRISTSVIGYETRLVFLCDDKTGIDHAQGLEDPFTQEDINRLATRHFNHPGQHIGRHGIFPGRPRLEG